MMMSGSHAYRCVLEVLFDEEEECVVNGIDAAQHTLIAGLQAAHTHTQREDGKEQEKENEGAQEEKEEGSGAFPLGLTWARPV